MYFRIPNELLQRDILDSNLLQSVHVLPKFLAVELLHRRSDRTDPIARPVPLRFIADSKRRTAEHSARKYAYGYGHDADRTPRNRDDVSHDQTLPLFQKAQTVLFASRFHRRFPDFGAFDCYFEADASTLGLGLSD